MYIVLHVKYALFLSSVNETWMFSSKNIKFHVRADLFHADGETDRH